MGTPHYMAPEAILDPSAIDGRVDLYALGATAYFLLTGEHVFGGTNLVEICSAHLHEAPVPPSKKRPDVPKSLEDAILACLAKKPDDRPRDAAALASMIRACALGDWTVEDAAEWWAARRKSSSASAPGSRVKRKRGTEVSVFGNTIAVALDDRAAG